MNYDIKNLKYKLYNNNFYNFLIISIKRAKTYIAKYKNNIEDTPIIKT